MSDERAQELAEIGSSLVRLRDDLEAELARKEQRVAPVDLEEPIGRLSRMDALQDQHLAQAEERRTRQRLVRVRSALARVADGDYGDCLGCGEPIELRRLRARPESTLCFECMREHEGA